MINSALLVMLVTELVICTISMLTVTELLSALKTVFDQSLSLKEDEPSVAELDISVALDDMPVKEILLPVTLSLNAVTVTV